VKIAGNIAGYFQVLIGAVWAVQDLNLLGGSFMTEQYKWLIIGIAVAIIGIAYYSGRTVSAAPDLSGSHYFRRGEWRGGCDSGKRLPRRVTISNPDEQETVVPGIPADDWEIVIGVLAWLSSPSLFSPRCFAAIFATEFAWLLRQRG
jgi:hypothetical protein